jgi:hypothetical protein
VGKSITISAASKVGGEETSLDDRIALLLWDGKWSQDNVSCVLRQYAAYISCQVYLRNCLEWEAFDYTYSIDDPRLDPIEDRFACGELATKFLDMLINIVLINEETTTNRVELEEAPTDIAFWKLGRYRRSLLVGLASDADTTSLLVVELESHELNELGHHTPVFDTFLLLASKPNIIG